MHKLLLISAALGIFATPAASQTQATPAENDTAATNPAPKPKTVTKTVCHDVDVERDIGSRLAPTTRICRKVEVPAPTNTQQGTQQPRDREGR